MNLRTRIKVIFLLFICYSLQDNPYVIDIKSIKEEKNTLTMELENIYDRRCPDNTSQIKKASVYVEAWDSRVLQFRLNDSEEHRWEVPVYNPNARIYFEPISFKDTGFRYGDDPFGFEIEDPVTNQVFLSTLRGNNNNVTFCDKIIEFGLWFPAEYIFGLGERATESFDLCEGEYRKCYYTSFNRDAAVSLDDGKEPGGKNVYGHHSFYLLKYKSGYFTGVFFLNSNAQDTIVERDSEGIKVSHKTIGGIVDFYFFYPGKAEEVIKNYHSFIGRPYLPPFWALGFHQCRWGWKTLEEVKGVVKKFEEKDIPLDVVWGDIDYMKDFVDFTIDDVNYKGLKEFVEDLHKKGMYWVPIIDAGLKYDEEDYYYIEGEKMNAFIKSARTKETLMGKVWPGHAVYLAWMTNDASKLWHMGLKNFSKLVDYDGIWLDMNEASTFCDGECPIVVGEGDFVYSYEEDPHDYKEFDNLPYLPGNRSLLWKAISPTGYHKVDPEDDSYGDKFYKEYNLHSLWALHQANATKKSFIEIQKRRPFILTRASFAGIGRHSSKWLGDNFSKWEDMRYSIIGIYNFQLFGVPLVGADICGFIGDTNEGLCARWMQLGAFYPFSRNHNINSSIPQEPYNWDSVAKAGRNAIRQKYSILRYYFTKLFDVSRHGGTLIKPLFFDYPNDRKIFEYRNKAFMIGPALMVAPVLEPNVTYFKTYLSNENWFNLFTNKQILKHNPKTTEGKEVELYDDFDFVNVLLRGGNIIPFQDAINGRLRKAKTLDHLLLEVIVAPDANGEASGNIIFDKEDEIDPIDTKQYLEIELTFSMAKKEINVKSSGEYRSDKEAAKFKRLSILGAESMSAIKKACIHGSGIKDVAVGTYYSDKRKLSFYLSNDTYWSDIEKITFGNNCG